MSSVRRKIKFDLYVNGLKKEINRKINVNDNMTMQSFCEHVIVSINGTCKHLYQLTINYEYSFLGPGCNIMYGEMEEMMDNLKLSDLDLNVGDELLLNYNFRMDWEIIIKVKKVEEGFFKRDFEVTAGKGQGILEDIGNIQLIKDCINGEVDELDKRVYSSIYKEFAEFLDKKFDISNINEQIDNYLENYREIFKPKRYIMNIALEGYKKEIKRRISVDSNVKLDKFCECVILSMNGDLSHLYGIKRAKEYIDDEIVKEQDLNYLELKEKQRLTVIYDFGDDWRFYITVSKVIDDYGNKPFEVLSGKGYGIIDDCGGIYGLNNEFKNKYDINDFDLKRTNQIIDIYF